MIEKLFQDEQTTMMKGTTYSRTVTTIGWLAPTVAFETWDATVTVNGIEIPFRMEFSGAGSAVKGSFLM